MNKILSTALTWIAVLALGTATAPTAQASVLMLDFGPTVAADDTAGTTGVDWRARSPYHTADPAFTDTTWNTVGTADVASGLAYSDGTTATGVAVNLGAVLNSTTINLATQPSSTNALGTATNIGVYGGTSVGRDGIFHGTGGQTTKLGVQITGLAAGTYDIYLTARNTNTGNNQLADVQTIYVGKGAAGTNFDTAAMTSASLTTFTAPTVATGTWVEGENYLKFTVTLGANEALNIGSGADGARGFLNSIQVALVPEPGSLMLMGFGGLIMLNRRRKG